MAEDKSENVTNREFDSYKKYMDEKVDALFSEMKELNRTIRELLIDRASEKALALIGRWSLVIIPVMGTILGVVALLWRKT